MHVVAAPDKFRGTATASAVARAIGQAARAADSTCDEVPLADGGDGTLDVLGGPNRSTLVTGPLGDPVRAGWRLAGKLAVVEMARASGLDLLGGASGNDTLSASTYGTGELISAAVDAGAKRVIVGVGGSASTDGGLAALRALYPTHRLRGVELVVACDVQTKFLDAAAIFGPQKGATPAQVELLRRRLERLAQVYLDDYGVDVRELPRSGAAGGLAGGLATVGAALVDGFELVSDEVELYERLEGADLVITGEGYLDPQSFEGKVVGGVAALAEERSVPVLAIVGDHADGMAEQVPCISLVQRFGEERAFGDTLACVEAVVAEALASGSPSIGR